MANTPFAPIYSNVVAHDIRSVKIVPDRHGYQPDLIISAHIQGQRRENPLKFDGVAWGLRKFTFSREIRTLTLTVYKGRYSQYRWTNLDPELRLRVPHPSLWFNAICPGALVITSDGKIFFGKRPEDAHLSPGKLDIPCGHPSDIEEMPSTKIIMPALRSIISKEIGVALQHISAEPLIQICEEPKLADDLIFIVRLAETSRELLRSSTKRGIFFLDDTENEIAKFLRTENNISRPVFLSLAYYGRRMFGEQMFLQFCREQN